MYLIDVSKHKVIFGHEDGYRDVPLGDGSRIEVAAGAFGPSLRLDGHGWHALVDLNRAEWEQLLTVIDAAREAVAASDWDGDAPAAKRTYLEMHR